MITITKSKQKKKQKKSKCINIRTTEKEYHKIKEYAQADHRTISEYIIKKSLEKKDKNTRKNNTNIGTITLCINMVTSVQEILNYIDSKYGFDENVSSEIEKLWKIIEDEVV